MLTPWRITTRPSASVIQRPGWSSGGLGAACAVAARTSSTTAASTTRMARRTVAQRRAHGRTPPGRDVYGQGAPWDFGGLQLVAVPVAWGVGEKLLVLPCVLVVVVVPTPAWLLPGPENVEHVTVPWTLVQLLGSGAAPESSGTPRTAAVARTASGATRLTCSRASSSSVRAGGTCRPAGRSCRRRRPCCRARRPGPPTR